MPKVRIESGSGALRRWLGAVAIGWLLGPVCALEAYGKDPLAGAGAVAVKSRQILVTFSDERVGRVGIGDTVASYRRRGDYGNSTWSERLAQALALDYGLTQRGLWPITTLGVHCVVYELKPDQSLNELLARLQRDARVESVQALHAYRAMSDEPPAPRHD